jgi:hypothetical protein
VFFIDIQNGDVVRKQRFGSGGDYEDIQLAGNKLFVLRSDGMLYRIEDWRADKWKTSRERLAVPGGCDAEGLALDKEAGLLLVGCKENPGKGRRDQRATFSYDFEAGTLNDNPIYSIDLDELARVEKSRKPKNFDRKKFKPSALAQQPGTGNWYYISSVEKMIVVLRPDGRLLDTTALPEDLFRQPEGLAFLPNGDLFISSEGAGKAGSLLRFNIQGPDLSGCGSNVVEIGGVEFTEQCLEVASGEVALALVDVDSDGLRDLLVASQSASEVIVFPGNGRGSFENPSAFDAGSNPTDFTAADLNGDALIDLAVANHETSYVTLLIGDGRGGFRQADNSPFAVNVRPHPHAVDLQDLDRDGRIDLVVDDRTGEGLLVFRGTGGGDFESEGIVVPVGGDPYRGFAIADLNADGGLDIVTPNPQSVGISLADETKDIAFRQLPALAASSPFAVVVADLNQDGHPDIVAASESGSTNVDVFFGDGTGAFQKSAASSFQMSSGAKDIAAGDINGDGFEDVLVTSWSSDVLVLLGGDDKVTATRVSGVTNPWGVAIADVNGDGKADFAIADGEAATVHLYTSR